DAVAIGVSRHSKTPFDARNVLIILSKHSGRVTVIVEGQGDFRGLRRVRRVAYRTDGSRLGVLLIATFRRLQFETPPSSGETTLPLREFDMASRMSTSAIAPIRSAGPST